MCGTCGCPRDPSPDPAPTALHPLPVSPRVEAIEPTVAASAAMGPLGEHDVPAPGSRRIVLEQRLLAHNDRQAARNRERFQRCGVRVVNLLSAPGSGKTSLLQRLARLAGPPAASGGPGPPLHPDAVRRDGCSRSRPSREPSGTARSSAVPLDAATPARGAAVAGLRQAVIVGDLATDNDARRLRAAGLPAVQISTGQGCHLEATQVAAGLDRLEQAGLPLADLDLLWIENVGNLVCPVAYDLGEQLRLVLLAAGEGEDKPLKYPALFQSADVVVISKLDLAAAVRFRRHQAERAIRRVAPQARIIATSARTGQGLAELIQLLRSLPPRAASGDAPDREA
jgi:hydrogenase nickel incorporation protein HypB